MEQTDSNYLKMVDATLADLDKDKSFWEDDAEIKETVDAIVAAKNNVTEKNRTIPALVTTGYTSDKNNAYERAKKKALKLCKKLSGYAKKKRNNGLLAQVDYSKSSLSRGTEKEVIDRIQAILTTATTLLTVLTTFKVTAAEIADIKADITEYQGKIDNRSNTGTEKTVTVAAVDTDLSELHYQLDILDDLIEGFSDDEGFIARYKKSRVVIDYGKDKTKANNKTVANTAAKN
jgi:hypothetical protein